MLTSRLVQFAKNSPNTSGGVENVTLSIYKYFKLNYKSSEVICFSDKNEISSDIKECKAHTELFSQKISLNYILKSFNYTKHKYKFIFHLPNYFAILSLIILKIFNRQSDLIIFWHSDILENNFLKRTFINLLRPLEIIAVKCSDRVIFTSEIYYENSYIKKFILKKKLRIVPLGIKDTCSQSEHVKFMENKKVLNLLFVGRLVKYKNIEMLIDAVENIQDIKLNIVGDGPLLDKMNFKIKDKNLHNRVKIFSNIDNNQLKEFYSKTDIFVLPSNTKAEAFGIVLIEAMMRSIPLITFDIKGSGVSWVNQHMKNGIVVSDQTSLDLSRAITYFKENPDILKLFAKASRERYCKHFLEETMLIKIGKVLIDS